MGQIIDVPGYGPTEFPDGMSDDEIVAAIQKNMAAKPQEPQAKQSIAQKKKEMSIADIFGAPIAAAEMANAMGTGVAGQVFGGLSGIKSLLLGEGVDAAAKSVGDVQKSMTYEPRTELAQGGMKAISYPFERGMEATKSIGGALGEKIGGEQGRIAGEAIGEQVIPVAGTLAGGYSALKGARAADAANKAALAAKSYQDAARIEAAKLAVEKYGLSIDPIVSNPTAANTVRVAAAGQSELNSLIRRVNESKVSSILKKDIGVPETVSLTSADVFKAVRDNAAAPKRQIQMLKDFADDGVTTAAIADIAPKSTIGTGPTRLRINKRISDANALLAKNPSGAELISEIETLRKNARRAYKAKDGAQTVLDMADADMALANALEGLIERNLASKGLDGLLNEYRAARTTMAKSYALEDATNLNTGLVDPMVIAKMTSRDNAMSGAFSDIGKIAGNYPESLGIKAGASGGAKEFTTTHMTRTGPAGMAGYVVGGMFGQPLLGAGIGAASGELLGSLYAKRLARNPAVQRAVSVPPDYRSMMTGSKP